ncbi:fibulin-2-like [Synchiropus splendidus]|uniref:fibulin-2-like n=1 Tax=Synchiropus splendidus TaxID=270530 RepID=UPI00237D658A|nr:fibulin-2-like [Synchiropus splendidus]
MDVIRVVLLTWTLLWVDLCMTQKDCTGVECPVLHNCIESVLENGACCPSCTQKGCTCEGYQYYDCVQAGFRKGKVLEGESYFVDFGSTKCSCPRGGGKISCQFIITCPEISPNCIEILHPADGCQQCGRIGCSHGDKKYEAGHSFQLDRCQVCHCPNEGGRLMCSPIPGCNKQKWTTTTENNNPLRVISSRHESRQTHPEQFSKLAQRNTLPLYKTDPPSFGTEDYDNTQAEPTASTIQKLALLLESTTAHTESSSTGQDDRRGSQRSSTSEGVSPGEVKHTMDDTATITSRRPTQGTVDGSVRHSRHRATLDGVKDTTRNKSRKHNGHHRHNHAIRSQDLAHHSQQTEDSQSEKAVASYPTIQFSPTSRAPVRLMEEEEQPRRLAQTLHSYQTQEVDPEVSAKELVETCCETGQKWASANGHCDNMAPPTHDRHSICWMAQQQCCLGSQRESQCSAGIAAAQGGKTCEDNDKCGINSYKECCSCCSLGLRFRDEGLQCKAHQDLSFQCQHIFVGCCEGEEVSKKDPWQRIRERPALCSMPPPRKVSDDLYPKEAFSIGGDAEEENGVEVPGEDVDECSIYEGKICHHRCVNTPGSFRCECFPGYVMQDDAFTCAPETVDEENTLREDDDRAAAKPTSALPLPTQHASQLDPCEGNLCEQQCTPQAGRPHCSCFPGFSLNADGQSCKDVDECVSPHACQINERCMNTAGSFICQRLITCPPGYQSAAGICEDVDECAQGTHNCGLAFHCVNTEGSFRCNPKPRCSSGFTFDVNGNCVDIDECHAATPPCGSGFNCINTVGSYICQRKMICSRGYHTSPDGSRCIDVDECQSGLHQCGDGQLCHNMPGSYRCECQAGYQYDSFRRMCMDVNECWRYPGRLCAQTCENTPGSYLCSCTSGFRLSSDGNNCEDVNECLSSPCSQECANIYGSYQCYCRQGYYLREDGHTCEDIDECAQSIGHLCTYKCVNVPGSYQCACPEYGYTMSASGRSCRDIDECSTGAHNCSLAETCYNIQGDYRCLSFTCPPNYRKVSDTRCERISCPNYLECQTSPLRITHYYLSFQSNIVIPAQIFRIGPSPAYSGDNVIVTITDGNEDNYFSTRKLNAYTGAVYLHRQVESPRDFLIHVEMKLWRQGTFTTFQAKIYVFITANSL